MKSQKTIGHDGRVVSSDGEKVTAEIFVSEACGSCQAKNMCFSKGKKMIVEAETAAGEEFLPGEEVNVNFEPHLAAQSVFLAYVLPLIVFFAVMFSVIALTGSQDAGCLAALPTVPAYYAVLYLFRNKLRRTFKFKVEKKNYI